MNKLKIDTLEDTIDLLEWDIKNNLTVIKRNSEQNYELKQANIKICEKINQLKSKLNGK